MRRTPPGGIMAATAVVVVAGLKAVARFDLPEEPLSPYRLLKHILLAPS